MHKLFLVILIFAIGPRAVHAHQAGLGFTCETRLRFEQDTRLKLGYSPKLSSVELVPFEPSVGAERFMLTARHPVFGTELAFLDYQVYPREKTLEIEKVDVLNSNNFRKGLSNLLFARMIEEQPHAVRIRARVVDMNLRVMLAAMERGEDCVTAFLSTPLFQTAAHFGFTKVTGQCNHATGEYNFVMEH